MIRYVTHATHANRPIGVHCNEMNFTLTNGEWRMAGEMKCNDEMTKDTVEETP